MTLLASQFTIITYGGSTGLYYVFNALASLFNGNGLGFLGLLITLFTTISLIYYFVLASIKVKPMMLITNFLFPVLFLGIVVISPKCTVHIEDALGHERGQVIDNVPAIFAMVVEPISTLSYKITKGLESVMHTVDDSIYQSTGMIYGADQALDWRKYKIGNKKLEEELKAISRHCIFYDLALGRYSIDQLKSTDNIWNFLENNSSKVLEVKSDGADGRVSRSCRDAIKCLGEEYKTETKRFDGVDFAKHLPLYYNYLAKAHKSQQDLVGQQVMINFLKENGIGKFLDNKAYLQQRSAFLTTGINFAKAIVPIRSIFEAILYGLFIFVAPFAFLPSGIKYLVNWLSLICWIHLWPPLFVLVNYITMAYAKSQLIGVFPDNAVDLGLSFSMSEGIETFCADAFSIGCYAYTLVPFLAYFILKGSEHAVIGMVSSMISPVQSAAGSAAAENVSGNISLATSNMGNASYGNMTSLQKSLSPSLSQGSISFNDGYARENYSATGQDTMHLAMSDVGASVNIRSEVMNSMNESYQNAQSSVQQTQESYSESVNQHIRNTKDFIDYLSNSNSYTEGLSSREAYDSSTSAKWIMNHVNDFADQHNMSKNEAMDAHLGVSVYGSGSQYRYVASDDHSLRDSLTSSVNNDFQESLQKVMDFSKSSSSSENLDGGSKFSEGVSASYDNMKSHQAMSQKSISDLNQISSAMSSVESKGSSYAMNLQQSFVNWASEKYSDQGGFSKIKSIFSSDSVNDKEMIIKEFSKTYADNFLGSNDRESFFTPSQAFENATISQVNQEIPQANISNESTKQWSTKMRESQDEISSKFTESNLVTYNNLEKERSSLIQMNQSVRDTVSKQQEKTLISKFALGNDYDSTLVKAARLLGDGMIREEEYAGIYDWENP
ncbi:conjugal transfer protein TraG N-terminal domain-containing protein [Chlamydiales bacterium]|nr:conjugal transfer protein TraG N-terminal domain-containing protein [Chlamydiales bacterium]